jgi:hypothetical protein
MVCKQTPQLHNVMARRNRNNSFTSAMLAASQTYGCPEGYNYQRDTLYRNDGGSYGGEEQYNELYTEARHASPGKPAGYDYRRDTLYRNDLP